MKKILLFFSCVAFLACSGGSDDSGGEQPKGVDPFDREAMLTNWADNIIIPAYVDYQAKLEVLSTKTEVLVSTGTDETGLSELRSAWLEAYKAFQHVSMFEIGKAEELKLHDFTNIYPAQTDANDNDSEGINQNIQSGSYDLTTLSSIDEQGFPALDYLLFGLAESDADILLLYTTDASADNYKQYLTDVVSRLKSLTDQVTADWQGNYRNTFINNSGSSSTSSINKLVNDFIFNYEKNVRAGKVGIPAGVFSSGTVFPDKVEAYYNNDVSKELYLEAVNASQDFFNGKAFDGSSTGESLKSYLDYMHEINEIAGDKLSDLINSQFTTIKNKSTALSNSFSAQIETDNSLMISLYDELQRNVVYFKVDMLSTLSISVDYVDADGD
ncbi:imelysin family protein [Galbibacter sp. EGI 63066]|uniref:imelysin family protein n=1 Tax=Galbibacter sp. EGI 63066 TaxID=2993559 RepID=UPI0022490924|nr:imelysin family protein [Galbibacter sp. EGI 63066]MCX2681100.1 imelysin family protein [Galbibacter sp. EGI 63066]